MREHIAKQASFLGAIRLPSNVFKGTGTEVTTDVIFFKRDKIQSSTKILCALPPITG
ncbi:SAM-dependent DNA methyltransferase [Helicobacter suis]|nr:SAM-dependent DNA methyltransferase [Helicobacter suis]